VLDFSVAKLDAPDAQLTRAGVVFGTPAYMSPEQGRGTPLDPRSDIYAVGIVAYEMLSGRPPFDAAVPTDVVMMHLRSQPAPLSGVPLQLSAIVMRALEKDPKKRQQTAEELDAQCQRCLNELFPRHTPGTGVPAAPPPAQPAVAPLQTATPSQRTMMAAPAPTPVPAAKKKGRTIALDDAPTATPQRTVALPESAGVVAFAEHAQRARAEAHAAEQRPAGPLFWLAWTLIGVGAGLAAHFWLLSHGRA
jgi:serine/threonine-protein kinase